MDEYTFRQLTPLEVTRIPIPIEEMKVLANLAVELTKLRQSECKHLAIENFGPELWRNLLHATYPPPMLVASPDSASTNEEK